MVKELSNSFTIAGAVEPTQKSIEELKQELSVAEIRDMMVEIITDGNLSIEINGKTQGLTKENALDKLTGSDGVTLDQTDVSTFKFFANMTRRCLFNNFQQTPPTEEHIEATYNAAMQSALTVLIEQQTKSIEYDRTIEAG